MTKKEAYICDCGCKKSAENDERNGWFIFWQFVTDDSALSNVPKTRGELHFSSIECFHQWSQRAHRVALRLSSEAQEASYAMGELTSPDCPQIYV